MSGQQLQTTKDAAGSGLFGHVVETNEALSAPFIAPPELTRLGWIEIQNGPVKIIISGESLARLLTLSNINDRQKDAISRILTRALARGNRVMITRVYTFLLLSNSVGGKGRKDIKETTSAATKSIKESVNLQRFRRLFSGKESDDASEKGDDDQTEERELEEKKRR